jgi:hypothetical protein
MANEAQVRSSLQIINSPLHYQSQPTAFTADVTGIKGPCPGAFAASILGTDVDLSELTTPGLCRIMNLDDTNFIEFGIWDPEALKFYPLGEVLPGETYVLRLSRNLAQEYAGTGTGTTGPETNTLRIRADTAPCNALVEAFEA